MRAGFGRRRFGDVAPAYRSQSVDNNGFMSNFPNAPQAYHTIGGGNLAAGVVSGWGGDGSAGFSKQQINPMRGPRKITDIIEDVYDAALEPARWHDVVAGVNEFVGGRACGIISKDSISKSGVTHYYYGVDPHFIQLYSETHSKFDPLATLPRFGQVVNIPDLVSFDEYRRGRFYQEWLQPQGCVDVANVVLEKSRSNCPVLLTMLSGKRMVDAEMRRRIGLLVPHLHRALMINQAIELKQAEAATFADILDGLSAGIFLVNARCDIVHANAAGESMLCDDDFLRSISGQLVARDAKASRGLREIVANGGVGMAANGGAFPLTAHDGARYAAHLLPLESVVRNGARTPSKAVAAIFVRKVELDGESCSELVGRAFGLTPAELRVLLAIVEVGGVPETSQKLGVAETTVKTHLQRVFSKTGASRQADLVKLAAGFANPLAN
jgi:DNA-binding CsgD family transcriptional regulator